MPTTPNYGFEYETPSTLPGITLTGGPSEISPILANQVDATLVSIDNRVAGAEADITAIENTLVGFEPVYARVMLNGSQSLDNNTVTVIQANTVEFTSQVGLWNAGLYQFVIPAGRGGIYLATAGVAYSANTTGRRSCDIVTNASRVASNLIMTTTTSGVRAACSAVVLLNPGDAIWFTGYQQSGGSLTAVGDDTNPTHLAITRLAPL